MVAGNMLSSKNQVNGPNMLHANMASFSNKTKSQQFQQRVGKVLVTEAANFRRGTIFELFIYWKCRSYRALNIVIWDSSKTKRSWLFCEAINWIFKMLGNRKLLQDILKAGLCFYWYYVPSEWPLATTQRFRWGDEYSNSH